MEKTDDNERLHSEFYKYFVEFNTDQDMHLEKKEIGDMIEGLNIPEKVALSKLKEIP